MANHKDLNNLIEEYTQAKLSRRQFVRRVIGLGLSMSTATALLAACAQGDVTPEAVQTDQQPTPTEAEQVSASPTPAESQVSRGGTFIEGYDRDFNKINPVASPWADPAFVAVYEFVMVRDAEGNFAPSLAKSWTVSDDATTWTFEIRDDATFHSGAPLTAENVVEDFNVFRDSEQGQNAIFWTPVENVRAGDEPNTVVVELKNPFAALPETIATEYAMIHNEATRQEVGQEAFGATTADGSGPFTLENFAPGNEVAVSRWEDYHGTGIPFLENKGVAYLDGIQWVPILEPSNRASEIETGNVHAIKNPAGQDVARLRDNDDLVVIEFQELSNLMINLNQQNTDLGFDDVRVRQAISHAIDRQAIVEAVFFGTAVPTYGPIFPGWKWYEPEVEQFNQYDPDRAAQLLDEAGFELNDGVRERDGTQLSFTLVIENNAVHTQVMEAITGMLAEVGIDMTVRALETAAFFEQILSEDPAEAWSQKWLWSSPGDLLIFFEAFPTEGYNQHGENEALQQSIEDWQSAADQAELEDAARRMQVAWAEFLPHIPIITPITVWVHQQQVHGWQPTQTMLYPFYNDVWVEGA